MITQRKTGSGREEEEERMKSGLNCSLSPSGSGQCAWKCPLKTKCLQCLHCACPDMDPLISQTPVYGGYSATFR